MMIIFKVSGKVKPGMVVSFVLIHVTCRKEINTVEKKGGEEEKKNK